jgi:hypothetical protein
MKMKVYFAHSMPEYNTKREQKALEMLKRNFSEDEVICPNNDLGELGSMEAYLDYIREEIDALVFMSKKNGWCGKGVYTEIEVASSKGIPVYMFKMKGNKFAVIDVTEGPDFIEINHNDWVDFAKIN